MNPGLSIIIVATITYLIGSISFARLIARWWTSGKDVTQHEIGVEGTEDRYKVLSIGGNSVALLLSRIAAIPPALRAARVRILEAVQYE